MPGSNLRVRVKRILSFLAFYTGIVHLALMVLRRCGRHNCAAVLFYHRFCEGRPNPYDLPRLDRREFERQMRHIQRWYNVISMDELAEKVRSTEGFKGPTVVVTIDDGFVDTYTLAFPILRRLQIPAIVYLVTGFIGTAEGPWVDELMRILEVTEEPPALLGEWLGRGLERGWDEKERRAAFSQLFQKMLDAEHGEKQMMMERLVGNVERRDTVETRERMMMSWEEVRELRRGGMVIGAHTVTHPTLSRMELAEAGSEIRESKETIERELGETVMHFAVPNGRAEDFSDDLKEYCREIGFLTVASTEPGLVRAESDAYFLRRILPPPPLHVFAFELMLKHLVRRQM